MNRFIEHKQLLKMAFDAGLSCRDTGYIPFEQWFAICAVTADGHKPTPEIVQGFIAIERLREQPIPKPEINEDDCI